MKTLCNIAEKRIQEKERRMKICTSEKCNSIFHEP